jgi:hypothetical protein
MGKLLRGEDEALDLLRRKEDDAQRDLFARLPDFEDLRFLGEGFDSDPVTCIHFLHCLHSRGFEIMRTYG